MLNLKGKNVLVAGLGLSGKAVLEMMSQSGANISVCDDRDIEWDDPRLYKKIKIMEIPAYFNRAAVPDEAWDYVILSPGIPMDSDFVINAKRRNATVLGELEFAYEISGGKFVAITGTNGKTTTTTLVGEIFDNSSMKSVVGGNIGVPVVSLLGEIDVDTVLITEVSSFQLESVRDFKPLIAAILNLTPDHLDRHKTMENYGKTKARVFENQDEGDYLIYNYDDAAVSSLIASAKAKKIPFSRTQELSMGVFVKDNQIVIKKEDGGLVKLVSTDDILIPGTHNLENVLAAAGITYFAGVTPEVIVRTIKEFVGVAHRLELVATKRGIRFVNDSKGTNPDASIKAIDAVGNNIFLIAGGYEKDSDFHDFIEKFHDRVKHLLLMGETKDRIEQVAIDVGFTHVTKCENMGEAVRLGYEYAEEGDTVLLSPASASWDMYKNFEERGDHFKEIIEELN
jgi:UDP-N-acetylmuramoylalanine--D-glutamate ligase